ncbi:serpin family protein [Paenibacillus albidus]|uniref:serpin family protein n=1 Tax=Paenibacillus albidus TaxID=2041023 RepID=UPI001667D816|nr:serpin family protein [Paenibacillus albidus]
MRKRWITFAASVLLLSGCTGGEADTMTIEQRKEAAAVLDSRLVQQTNRLGLELFSQLRKEEAGNLSLSPYSIGTAMALAYNGSDAETSEELGTLLGYAPSEREQLNADHSGMMELLNHTGDGIQLSLANSVWTRKELSLRKDYLQTLQNQYSAEHRTTDLAGAQGVEDINKWVADNTAHKIKDILREPPGNNAVAVLVNAVYFKAGWKKEFNKEKTKPAAFHPAAGPAVQVDMMQQSGSYLYAQSEDWQAVKLPYGEGQMDMLVILPAADFSLEELQTQLKDGAFPGKQGFGERSGEIRLPRFQSGYGTDLKQAVQALGVQHAFDPRTGNFSRMADIPDPIYISRIVHQSWIEVNERGTEAAASTLIDTRAGSAPPVDGPFEMIVDRPFFYAVEDAQTGLWLFLGEIEDPTVTK